ncbi:MAG: TonB-dependent receptor [Chitinophagaceae bacterium]|nr:TonB-dependent receptor [Chitinophagaceae bacterium]
MKALIRILIIVSCVFPPAVSIGQDTGGRLEGSVKDSAGNSLAGAVLTLTHQPTGTVYAGQALSNGLFYFSGLRIGGPYQLTASYVGWKNVVLDGLQVRLGDPLRVEVLFSQPADQLQEVVVSGKKAGNRVGRYGSGTNITSAQIQQMPAVSRSLQDITRLVPQGSRDNSFQGTNYRYNNFTIDGAINNDAIGFSPSAGGQTGTSGQPGSSTRTNPISLDAIADMQVELAPYDVRIGNFTGGNINAVTKSGANNVSGSVYFYGRNAAITGKDPAGGGSKTPSAFHDLQTGFSVGLPLIKNKLFWFTNEEITRRNDVIQQGAGSSASAAILSLDDAVKINQTLKDRYNFDGGTYGNYEAYARSNKIFNRIDWNISSAHQLAIRNNTVTSESINMERDQQDFRFGSIAYKQTNNQTSTVVELKSRWSNIWSNSFTAGYSAIHDYRDPLSDPAFPQVQIVGRTPGSTIFLGTDREASIFNMKQNTIEITDNADINLGKHHLTAGTHNELYNITYGFVNAWNGRVDYPSIEDFLAGNPNRVRGSYNYVNNTREYILSHPGAKFHINFYSLYIQDEIRVDPRFTVTLGMRADYVDVPHKQILSDKTRNALTDTYYGTTYTYTPLRNITGHYFNGVQLSPRIGFRAELLDDRRLILRGGGGVFSGRIPFAWLGYSFYNNGDTYGAYDQRTDNGSSVFASGSDPLRYDKTNGIASFATQNGQVADQVNAGKTQVDVVDNHFSMPKVFRVSLAADYTDDLGIKYSIEGIYSKTIKDVMFQQVNLKDNPSYYIYDSAITLRKQPVFPSGGVNSVFANAYEMSNTSLGHRFSITGKVSKTFPFGMTLMAAYTYGQSKDVSNGIRNSMESNWQLNQSLNPNNPTAANSNFDIRHRIVVNAGYTIDWSKTNKSRVVFFFSAQSGSPFTYGFLNYTIQNTPQQVSLAYIPQRSEAVNFFADYVQNGVTVTAGQQAEAFNKFIDANAYLRGRRGNFTGRNEGRTPWNNQLDFRLEHSFSFATGKASSRRNQQITFTWDIINLTNLLNKDWGWVYFSPNTYNSTASVGLVPYIPARSSQGSPLFQFVDPGKPYSVDFFNSRWQMQAGVRYSF